MAAFLLPLAAALLAALISPGGSELAGCGIGLVIGIGAAVILMRRLGRNRKER